MIRFLLWVSMAGAAFAGIARADDWPHFLGPTHDGVSAETGLLKEWPEQGPPIAWEMATGETYAAPSIVRGRLILFHRVGDEEVVESLDAKTGKRDAWRFAYATQYVDKYGYNAGPRAAPAIHDGRVYTFGAEGELHCLDFETGKKLWHHSIKKEHKVDDNFFGVGSAPVIEGDLLLIAAGGADGAGVVALDRKTGRTVWKASDQKASYATPYCATIHGKRRVLHFGREGLVSIDAGNGKVNWSYPFRSRLVDSVNAAGPVVAGDLVFVSATYRTGAVLLRVKPDGDGVEEVWKSQVMGNHWATSILDDGYLYGFDGRHSNDTTLKCVELKTGKQMWAARGLLRGSMIRADGRYILVSETGALVLAKLTPKGADVLWNKEYLTYPTWIAPVLADKHLYIRNDKKLVCLDLRPK